MEHSDDPTIQDAAVLWRRIRPDQIVRDDNLNRLRPSTGAFEDCSNDTPMSVQLAEIVLQGGGSSEAAIAGFDGFALAGFTAGFARHQCHQGVERAPLPNDPAHAYVFGKKTDGIKKKFAREGATWVIPVKISSGEPT
jgi:hypothetical protein